MLDGDSAACNGAATITVQTIAASVPENNRRHPVVASVALKFRNRMGAQDCRAALNSTETACAATIFLERLLLCSWQRHHFRHEIRFAQSVAALGMRFSLGHALAIREVCGLQLAALVVTVLNPSLQR